MLPDRLASAPTLPDVCIHLWTLFMDLHSSRGNNGYGPNRIGYSDLDAYQRATRTRVSAWEFALIRKADDAFLETVRVAK